ncbi:MAG: arginine deiminase family protein [Salipiger marinus]|uniref:arginine deiminase family protein n=1 Tax=Salipiger marinus TaxID=555512 RepID=UPI004058FBAC
MTLTYGVHSEAGVLRRVLVHRPGSEMARLTPANAESLLFDDVLWVKQARIDHMAFVDVLRDREVEVVLLREMLEVVVADPVARRWLLDARINDNSVGVGLARDLHACLMESSANALTHILIGGMSRTELPIPMAGVVAPMLRDEDFLLAPMPNQIFTRDSSAWIYGGVALNPMFWPARRLETLNLAAIYRFHPDFRTAEFPVWFGDPLTDHGPDRKSGRRGRGLRLCLYRCLGVDGRAGQRLGRPHRAAVAFCGDTGGDGSDRHSAQQVPALPAGLSQPRYENGRENLPDLWHRLHGSDRRGVRIPRLGRVRSGREPAAFDQGGACRHHGRLKCASWWPWAAMPC